MGSRPGRLRTVTLAALRGGLRVHFSLALKVMGALLGLCAICGAATGPEAQYVDAASGTDWPGFGRTYGEQHFSPLIQIDSRNVSRLGLAWYIDLPPGN